jgi:glycosyltransferase involved in cell wall biosynthesis
MNTECLIVIPVFNEERNILKVLSEIRAITPEAYVCVVDDCSSDSTLKILNEAADTDPKLTVLSHPLNQGYGVSIQTGYKFARLHQFAYVIQLDGDLQHDPKDIPHFIQRMHTDYPDVILGSRFGTANDFRVSFLKRAAIRVFRTLLRLRYGINLKDPTTGYQMLSARAFNEFCNDFFPSDYPDANLIGLGLGLGLRYVEISVKMRYREAGDSMHAGIFKKAYYMYKVTFLTLLSFIPRVRHAS